MPSALWFRVGPALGDDLIAEVDALVADARAAVVGGDEHFDLLSAFSAERAREFGFRPWMYMHASSLAPAVDRGPAARPPVFPPWRWILMYGLRTDLQLRS